jgi:putative membrane protein
MKVLREAPPETELLADEPALVLASNRTGLSFERTRMGADRTLMAILRTSLSLIGFGFTIHTVFQKLGEAGTLALNQNAPRNFGLALLFIGVTLLVMGIAGHMRFQRQLTARHDHLFEQKLVRHGYHYSATPTFFAAAALLLVGLAAIVTILFNMMG